MNLTNLTAELPTSGTILIKQCKEWCLAQQLDAKYGDWIILLIANLFCSFAWLIIYSNSERIPLKDEDILIILRGLIMLMFLVNAFFGVYFTLR